MALTQISTQGIKDGTITGTDLATNVDLVDNQKLRLGTGNDLQIYHDGSNSYLEDTGTGALVQKVGGLKVRSTSNELMILALQNNQVELYYDGSKKFETTSTGVTVTGSLTATSNLYAGSLRFNDHQTAYFGTGNDLQIYHTGHHNIIDSNIGNLYIKHGTENMAAFIQDGPVTLYHDNIPTLVTDTNGIIVKGPEGDYGAIFLYADEGDDNADKWVMIALASGGFKLQNFTSGSWEDSIKADGNGSVTLYYDSSRKFETKSGGVAAYGGSSSVASHISQDYMKIQGKKVSILSDPSMITMLTNDFGYDNAYQKFLEYYIEEDTLLVIMISGG